MKREEGNQSKMKERERKLETVEERKRGNNRKERRREGDSRMRKESWRAGLEEHMRVVSLREPWTLVGRNERGTWQKRALFPFRWRDGRVIE